MADESSHMIGGWFHERNSQWPGIALSLQVKKELHHGKSSCQDVLAFESTHHGNVLVLDGAVQCVEHDEFAYQEMITNLGMMNHPEPRNVLVIGGGDGGVLREVCKHSCVEKAELCDIDEMVPEISKKYLKGMAAGFDDKRTVTVIGDGLKFIKEKQNHFDVIITDSSDPDGPAKKLFEEEYFRDCYAALKDGGILVTQAETFWNTKNIPLIKSIKQEASRAFPVVEWGYASTPTYPYGSIGFFVMSKDPKNNVKVPTRRYNWEEEKRLFMYYNQDVHAAAFQLPTFARTKIFGE